MSAWSMGRLEGAASFHTSPLFSSKASGAPSLTWLKMGVLLLGLKLKRTFLDLEAADYSLSASSAIAEHLTQYSHAVPVLTNHARSVDCIAADRFSVPDHQMGFHIQ